MTAMMMLTFNNMQNDHHDKLLLDDQLVDTGLRILEQILEDTQSDIIRSFHDTCLKMHRECRQKRAERLGTVNDLDISAYLVSP